MKNLNLTFDDKDFEKLKEQKDIMKKIKKCKSWEQFIVLVAKHQELNDTGGNTNDKRKNTES